jgi:hypothetical protein
MQGFQLESGKWQPKESNQPTLDEQINMWLAESPEATIMSIQLGTQMIDSDETTREFIFTCMVVYCSSEQFIAYRKMLQEMGTAGFSQQLPSIEEGVRAAAVADPASVSPRPPAPPFNTPVVQTNQPGQPVQAGVFPVPVGQKLSPEDTEAAPAPLLSPKVNLDSYGDMFHGGEGKVLPRGNDG